MHRIQDIQLPRKAICKNFVNGLKTDADVITERLEETQLLSYLNACADELKAFFLKQNQRCAELKIYTANKQLKSNVMYRFLPLPNNGSFSFICSFVYLFKTFISCLPTLCISKWLTM